jgi:hypothetical protein
MKSAIPNPESFLSGQVVPLGIKPNQGDTACLPDRQAWLIIISSFKV